jgi:hypothetical protein
MDLLLLTVKNIKDRDSDIGIKLITETESGTLAVS